MDIDHLKLENQLCFPLYVCGKEVIRRYKPFLDEIGLTYTQYIAMMVLWQEKSINVKSLGEHLYLDSGTLTPLLKKLEIHGLVTRERSTQDERNVMVTITEEGEKLKEAAAEIPEKIGACIPISKEDAQELYRLLYNMLGNLAD